MKGTKLALLLALSVAACSAAWATNGMYLAGCGTEAAGRAMEHFGKPAEKK